MRIKPQVRYLVGILAICAGPAVAFQPPTGCTGVVTVQYPNCVVEHIWTCEHDADGEQWIGLFGEEGPYQIRRVDREFQWLETYRGNPLRTELMQPNPKDPASLTELLSTGEDLYDFNVEFDGVVTRYQGYDRLTGETVVIDGAELLRTEYSYQALDMDGNVLRSIFGNQYVSEPHNTFLFGTAINAETPDEVDDMTPKTFAYPGEDGFMATRPTHGCGVILSSYTEGGA